MSEINYDAGAGLYPCKTFGRNTKVRYRRFESAAEALRFAIEEMPASQLRGSILEVEDARFTSVDMRRLYDATAYPLQRSAS